jgi:hypothetical protein
LSFAVANLSAVLLYLSSTPKLKSVFKLEMKKADLKDPQRLIWQLSTSADNIAKASKTSVKFGSKQSKAAVPRRVIVSILPDQDESIEDPMDVDVQHQSFQDSLADKPGRVLS